MEKVIARIAKTENNYAACVDGLDGFVCTAETFDALKNEIAEGIEFHLDGLREDGDPVPALFAEEYEIEYKWDVESLLDYYKGVLTLSALERITGINQAQLGHYAAGRSRPRKQQVKKIETALHRLGDELKAVSF